MAHINILDVHSHWRKWEVAITCDNCRLKAHRKKFQMLKHKNGTSITSICPNAKQSDTTHTSAWHRIHRHNRYKKKNETKKYFAHILSIGIFKWKQHICAYIQYNSYHRVRGNDQIFNIFETVARTPCSQRYPTYDAADRKNSELWWNRHKQPSHWYRVHIAYHLLIRQSSGGQQQNRYIRKRNTLESGSVSLCIHSCAFYKAIERKNK